MILVDSNVFMYAAGTEHPSQAPSVRFLDAAARGHIDAVVDAEVLQEILHRYRAIGRWHEGRRVYDLSRTVVPVVLDVTAEVLDGARDLLDEVPGLSARDALHAAVARINDVEAICTFDRDFDRIPGIRRVEPEG